jgi:hypothetical protein
MRGTLPLSPGREARRLIFQEFSSMLGIGQKFPQDSFQGKWQVVPSGRGTGIRNRFAQPPVHP